MSYLDNRAMDFDDLLLNTIRILENNPDIKKAVIKKPKWRYITADEGHDSSKTDLRIIQLLAGENQNICFIFDDYQSIYGFRGADLEMLL